MKKYFVIYKAPYGLGIGFAGLYANHGDAANAMVHSPGFVSVIDHAELNELRSATGQILGEHPTDFKAQPALAR